MKVFREEIERRKTERRNRRSSTWGGLLLKLAIFILLILLIRFIISPDGKRFGDYWHNAAETVSQERGKE
ncbi:MAG: hypothetical protein K9M99_05465 [Candidatus Cloacimonetes bacterium]|nr:hypothetical protein [Candidatus Cloacimonadota bacterium]